MDNTTKEEVTITLDIKDIDFLLKEWRRKQNQRTERENNLWGHIAFKLNTALFQNDKKID